MVAARPGPITDQKARHAEAQRRWRQRHPEHVRAWDAYYAQTERGKEVAQRSKARWKERNPLTVRMYAKASSRLWNAIRRGRLAKSPCEVCGEQRVQAHHPNGYEGDAALDVRWLCLPHHRQAHGRG